MASKDKTILMEQEDERAAVLNYLKENKMLLISVDPGYDGFKIYINNRQFLSKSLVVRLVKVMTLKISNYQPSEMDHLYR